MINESNKLKESWLIKNNKNKTQEKKRRKEQQKQSVKMSTKFVATRKSQETGFSKDTQFKKCQFHPTVQEKPQRHSLNLSGWRWQKININYN